MWKATFKVGARLCEMTYDLDSGQLHCDWSPDTPHPDSFTKDELEQYTAGRNGLLQKVAAGTGGRVIIFE
jgi:hypothetical protein